MSATDYPDYPTWLKAQPQEHHGIAYTISHDDTKPQPHYTISFTHNGREYTKSLRSVDEHYPKMVARAKIEAVLGICPIWDEQQ